MADLVLEDGTGLTTSNSYADLDEADLYHEMRLHVASWTSASDDDKEAALMWATRLLDELVDWNGNKYTEDQALRWPRSDAYYPDGYNISYIVVPDFLKNATAEYARHLIDEDRLADSDTKGFTRIDVSSISLYIDKYDRAPDIPKPVWNIIRWHCIKFTGQTRMIERG